MKIQEMIERKRELGYSNKTLSKLSGVPEATIQKIFSGSTTAPRKSTLDKLAAVLAAKDNAGFHRPVSYLTTKVLGAASVLMDSPSVYGSTAKTITKKDGEYTLDDYLALPDDQRVELIDGVFYDMAAPTSGHQAIEGYLHKIFLDHILEKKGPCIPLVSPIDVQLDEDDRTVVQPDVVIICDRSKFQNGRVFGAPDFICEVLSPSTKKKDMYLKLFKYMNAGVREYWMVDPQDKTVLVYDLEHQAKPVTYTFDDCIPVLIWDGDCEVDFSAIYDFVSFLYQQ